MWHWLVWIAYCTYCNFVFMVVLSLLSFIYVFGSLQHFGSGKWSFHMHYFFLVFLWLLTVILYHFLFWHVLSLDCLTYFFVNFMLLTSILFGIADTFHEVKKKHDRRKVVSPTIKHLFFLSRIKIIFPILFEDMSLWLGYKMT